MAETLIRAINRMRLVPSVLAIHVRLVASWARGFAASLPGWWRVRPTWREALALYREAVRKTDALLVERR